MRFLCATLFENETLYQKNTHSHYLELLWYSFSLILNCGQKYLFDVSVVHKIGDGFGLIAIGTFKIL